MSTEDDAADRCGDGVGGEAQIAVHHGQRLALTHGIAHIGAQGTHHAGVARSDLGHAAFHRRQHALDFQFVLDGTLTDFGHFHATLVSFFLRDRGLLGTFFFMTAGFLTVASFPFLVPGFAFGAVIVTLSAGLFGRRRFLFRGVLGTTASGQHQDSAQQQRRSCNLCNVLHVEILMEWWCRWRRSAARSGAGSRSGQLVHRRPLAAGARWLPRVAPAAATTPDS